MSFFCRWRSEVRALVPRRASLCIILTSGGITIPATVPAFGTGGASKERLPLFKTTLGCSTPEDRRDVPSDHRTCNAVAVLSGSGDG